jgi:ABC-type uncharacterized transport system permease subunit
MNEPSTGQLLLVILSVACFAVGGAISLTRIRGDRPALRLSAKVCMYLGVTTALGVIAWHSWLGGRWQPLKDNFESLLWLAVLLALFVMYIQRFRPIGGLDWFIMPIVMLLLSGAIFFGRLDYRSYSVGKSTWISIHTITAYCGAVAFAIAAAGGAMYMVVSRRLRNKTAGPKLGSLERLEHLMMVSVTLGFALLTVGLITGFGRMIEDGGRPPYAKLLLASLSWLVYAVIMHAPITPRLRGRRAAILSMCGFALMIGTLVAVQFMPGGTR